MFKFGLVCVYSAHLFGGVGEEIGAGSRYASTALLANAPTFHTHVHRYIVLHAQVGGKTVIHTRVHSKVGFITHLFGGVGEEVCAGSRHAFHGLAHALLEHVVDLTAQGHSAHTNAYTRLHTNTCIRWGGSSAK
jgi:hypothetical protein